MLASAWLWWGALAHAGTVKASSEGKDAEGVVQSAALAVDGLLTTGWAEGESGGGKGSWLELKFDKPVDVASVSLWPGRLDLTPRSLREYGRPSYATLSLTTATGVVSQQVRLLDPGEQGAYRQDVPVVAPGATALKITFDEVQTGGIYDLTYLSEVAVNFAAGGSSGQQKAFDDWFAKGGLAALDKNKEEVIALFGRIQAAEFGDRDALAELMNRAADGVPALRAQALKSVPVGFRLAAIRPDDAAFEALLKLKDANAIAAIELAALRSLGSEAALYRDRAQIFRAYQQMVGGGRRNLPAWGTSGWEKGALQGFGEPLPVAVSAWGDIFLADTGNNRVQRFDPKGVGQQVWGAEPDVANAWFGNTRAWYASGAKPGEESGQFVNPLAVQVLPGKRGAGFVALDAKGRVTVVGEDGAVQRVFVIPHEGNVSPEVGGEAHLLLMKKRVVVIWGNEIITYTLEGEPVNRGSLADGAPTGAVALAGGKVGLVYGPQLVLYGLDGFRFGDVMDGALGEGWESWSATTDEKGKLWAVLDTGEVLKFKAPGVVDLRFPLTDWSLHVPRIAAYDDFVYVTSDDTIIRGDALALSAPKDAAP